MRLLTKAATAAALVLVGCGLWPATASAEPDPVPSVPLTTIDADGTYQVGTQVVPGAYSTAGPVGDGVCSFKVVSGDNIVDSAFTKKAQVVQVGADATTFKTNGCQPWQPADCSAGCGPSGGSPQQILGQLGTFLLPRLGTPAPPG